MVMSVVCVCVSVCGIYQGCTLGSKPPHLQRDRLDHKAALRDTAVLHNEGENPTIKDHYSILLLNSMHTEEMPCSHIQV